MRWTRKRTWILVLVLLCTAYAFWWRAESRKVELEISKDTTYITGPLNEDGTVNYVAHINAQLSEGVTPENNAAVILVRAVGPTLFHEDVRERGFRLLGMAPPPAKGDYFVVLGEYVDGLPEKDRLTLTVDRKAAAKRYKELSAKMMSGGTMSMAELAEMTRLSAIGGDVEEIAYNQLEEAMWSPWSAEKLPVIAGWLKANAKPLAVIETATKSRHLYIPRLSRSDPPTILDITALNLGELANAGQALPARAMLKTSSGDLAGAWKDLLTCRRLARLISQGGFVNEGLVGIALEALACSGCHVMVTGGKASATQLRAWGAQLEALEPLSDIRKAIATELLMFFDAVMMMYRGQRATALRKGMDEGDVWWIDWNEVLRTGNYWYRRSLAPLTLCNIAERRARIKEVDQEMEEMVTEEQEMSVFDWVNPTARREKLTKAMTRLLLVTVWPGLSKFAERYDYTLMYSEMLQVTVALALHEAETGRFPAKLADLVPKYLKAVPTDLFSSKPLMYKHEGKGCVLYSVGENLTDDGGIYNREDEDVDFENAKDDIVIRFKR